MNHHKKEGAKVNPTERIANLILTSIKGSLATFCDRVHIGGTGALSVEGSGTPEPTLSAPHPTLRLGWGRIRRACDPSLPSTTRRLILPVLLMTCALMGLSAASALAAPEAPTLELTAKTPTEATLKATVTATDVSEGDTYELLYKKSAAECKTGSHSTPGLVVAEEFEETLKGLQPGATYTVCLLLENGAHETAESPPVTFLLPPEAPLTEAATVVTPTTALLHGVLNPAAKLTAGAYFEYSTETMSCENGLKTPRYPEEEVQAKQLTQKAIRLEPSKTYTFCLIASVETAPGSKEFETTRSLIPQSFTTGALPPAVESESASVNASEATLHAEINPNNQKTKYFFEYATSEAEVLAAKGTMVDGAPPAPELENFGPQGVEASTAAPLAQGMTYYYRVLAENAAHEKTAGKIEHFTTYTPAEKPEALAPSPLFATVATLHGVLDPSIASGTPSQVLDYEFVYRETNEKTCKGAGEVTTTQGMSLGSGREEVSQQITGLKPGSEYTVCLLAHNSSNLSEETASPPVSFKTAAATKPEAPEATIVFHRKATTSTLYGVVNPHAEGEPGSYRFLYAQSTSVCTGGVETAQEPVAGIGVRVEANIGGLQAGKPYAFCVEAFNALGEATLSAPKTFVTAIPPEPPTGLEAKPIGASAVTLLGTLNPHAKGEAGTYEFLYKNVANGPGCEGESKTPVSAASGAQGELATAKLSGLQPGKPYTFCLLARNEAGDLNKRGGREAEEETVLSGPVTFTTLLVAAPAVEAQFTTDLASTSVTLHATLNPEGGETTYAFEYAAPGDEFSPVIEPGGKGSGTLPAGTSPVPLEVHVQEGLQASTTYRFRVKLHNAAEQVTSEPVAFTTQAAGGSTDLFTLPDNRGYEMVTPVQKQGSLFKPAGAIRAAVSGDAIADIATVPTESGPGGDSSEQLSVLSTRTSAGWSSRTITAPHLSTGPPLALEDNGESILFSEDLSSALVEPEGSGFEQLSPQATEPTAYLHTLFSNGNVAEACDAPDTSAQSCYAPLVSASNDTANPFVPFGELRANGSCLSTRCGPKVRAGTPDLSHLVLTSEAPLTATAAPGGLYEYSAGRLQLVSILPGQTQGSSDLELAGREKYNGTGTGTGDVAARHAISDDGSRVVMDEAVTTVLGKFQQRRLYLRDLAKGETIRLDQPASEPGTEASVEPEYVDANAEGSRIFFLDSARLTADSGATYDGFVHPPYESPTYEQKELRPDLYECAITEENGKDHCALTDLTPKTEAGESAKVAGVLGASEDGSYMYFAAAGGLGIAPAGGCFDPEGEGTNATGEDILPVGALCNVFVRHDGVTKLVAALSQQDNSDWLTDDLTGAAVRVAPNGQYLAFTSDRGLTGYDTQPQVPTNCKHEEYGEKLTLACDEVYLYHAPANLQTEAGTLSCASCDPTGSRPAGSAGVPGWPATFTESGYSEAYYQPRYLSDEGRLFFNSPDALVPLDVSKQSEVYEYEPLGAGTCTESTSSGSELYVPQEHGCVALISTGTAAEGARFLEAAEGSGEGEHGEAGSQGGRDVFFLTTEKVLPQDVDSVPDVYDAHECTTASPCIGPPSALRPCETEASCKAPPTPQPTIYAAPATATFSGPGNVIPPPAVVPKTVTKKTTKCKKGDVKNKKGKCVKKPKKKKTKAKKSAHVNRRTSR
jgi:hypothetical protein